jgi:predicted 3-demethylubiquinone-9 3-methyltransferase (glyoxalase superfamily)
MAITSNSRKITPWLWFDTLGEEAANFYVSVFKNSAITGVSRYGDGGPIPAGTAMTVSFELDGTPFVALNGGPAHAGFTESVSFLVDCEDQNEVDYFWERLGDGGEEGPCGWVKDRYGLSWQIIPSRLGELVGGEDAEGAQRAMGAMMQMTKIVVADLEAAYAG